MDQNFFDSPAVLELSEFIRQKAETPDAEREPQHHEGYILRPRLFQVPNPYFHRGQLRELVEGGAQ